MVAAAANLVVLLKDDVAHMVTAARAWLATTTLIVERSADLVLLALDLASWRSRRVRLS
jgi:hypothetical protein